MQELEPCRITKTELIELLNQDLAREVADVTCYATAAKMYPSGDDRRLSALFRRHADTELSHALTLAAQIDSLGGNPQLAPVQDKAPEESRLLMQSHLDGELASIASYRMRVHQCESLGEHALAQSIRNILDQEQEQLAGLIVALAEPSGQPGGYAICR